MLINNKDLSIFSAELIDRKISTTNITSNLEWFNNSSQNILLSQYEDYKRIKLQFLINGNNEDDAFKKLSALTEELKKCVIRFDDIELLFDCVLDGYFVPDRQINGVFKVEYYFKNGKIQSLTPTTVQYSFVPKTNIRRISINFYLNNGYVFGNYIDAFDEDEIIQPLGDSVFYYDTTQVATVATNNDNWTSFFLGLGLDINMYKPATNNTHNGFVEVGSDYTTANAIAFVATHDNWNVYYTRFHKDGYPDLPVNVNYPSITISTGATNDMKFNMNVGQGMNPIRYKVDIIGKFNNTDYTSAVKYYLWDTGAASQWLYMINNNYYVYYKLNNNEYNVQLDGWGGKTAATLVNSSYGLLDKGTDTDYKDMYFNSQIIAPNLTLYNGAMPRNTIVLGTNEGAAHNFDLTRVRIYYDNEIYNDYIPIAGNLKNGFINNYGVGLYDINKMRYLRPVNAINNIPTIPDILPIPSATTQYPLPR